jgi:hypothetical protein
MNSDWPLRCVVTLTLRGALQLGDELRDLRITAIREGGAWEPLADGVGERFNAQVHPVRWTIASETAGGLELDLRADILPDPWVSGGTAAWRVVLRREAGVWNGSFAGTHTPLRAPTVALRGPAEVRVDAPFTVTGALPEAEPRILDDWRRHRGAGLLGDWTRCGELADGGGADACDRVVRAVDHGVRPDSGRDATAGIQAAIDACAAGGGGIVELPAGRLDIACERDDAPLRIRSDRIHLRGAGSGADGTLVYAHRPGRSDRRHQPWRANQSPRLLHIGALPARTLDDEPPLGAVLARIAAPAARGDRRLRLAPGHGLTPGIHLLEQHDPADLSLGAALTAPSGQRAANWRVPGRAVVAHYVRVTAVDGEQAELDHPLPHAIEPRWTPLLRRQPLLSGCAVSGLRFATAWDSVFEHHRDDVHDNGWDGIRADRVSGLLLRDIVFESVSTAASLKDAFACRIEDCRITGNPGHNGFGLCGTTTRCLLLRLCFGRAMHACNMQGTIAQNALVDCEGDEPSGIDFHGSAGLDTLIDRLTGCVCTGGGSADNVPPRHGPGLVLWNWRTGTFHPYHANRPLTCVADAREMPRFIAVGVHGRRPLHVLDAAGRAIGCDVQADWGWVEQLNRPTTPASLWRWQRGL